MKKSGQIHVCFLTLPLNTVEHLKIHSENLNLAGVETCFLSFVSQGTGGHQSKSKFDSTMILGEKELRQHLAEENSAAVVLQSPYYEHYPEFLPPTLRSVAVATVFFGYGLPLNVWEGGQTRLESFSSFSAIASATRGHYKALKSEQGSRAILAGDALMHRLVSQAAVDKSNRSPNRKRVLWAPHWSQSWFGDAPRGFSRFSDSVGAFAQLLNSRSDIELIFRPHPLLELALNNSKDVPTPFSHQTQLTAEAIAKEDWHENFAQLQAHQSFRWSTSSLEEDVRSADLLVTEGVAILGQWGVTGKPMIVWRDSESPRLTKIGLVIAHLNRRVSNAEELINELDTALDSDQVGSLQLAKARLVRSLFKFVQPNPSVFVLKKLGILN